MKSKLKGWSSDWTSDGKEPTIKNKKKCGQTCDYCPAGADYDFYTNASGYGFAKNIGRGGQCKFFAHLILKRAVGEENIPTYNEMDKQSTDINKVQHGDVIFKKNHLHTAIVVDVKRDKGLLQEITVVESNKENPEDGLCNSKTWWSLNGEAISTRKISDSKEWNQYWVWTGVSYYNTSFSNQSVPSPKPQPQPPSFADVDCRKDRKKGEPDHCKYAVAGDQYQCTTYVQEQLSWVGHLGVTLQEKKSHRYYKDKNKTGACIGGVAVVDAGNYGHVGIVEADLGSRIRIRDRNYCCDGVNRVHEISVSKVVGYICQREVPPPIPQPPVPGRYNSKFIRDVTIPDGTIMQPGQRFEKKWEIKNTGDVAWRSNTVRAVPIDSTAKILTVQSITSPDNILEKQSVVVSVDMRAPNNAGRYKGVYQLQADGKNFGQRFYVDIVVAASPPPTQYEGWIDSADCDVIRGWAWDKNKPDRAINVNIYDGNTKLDTIQANEFRKDLLNAGKGNGNHAFNYSIPSSFKRNGSHNIYVKYSQSDTNLHGSPKTITCNADPRPPPPSPDSGRYSSKFIRDVTIPDGTIIQAGQQFEKKWELKNSGDAVWRPNEVRIIPVDTAAIALALNIPMLPHEVAPGQNVIVTIPMKAPSNSGSYKGTYQLQARTQW
ncbi:MAG: hypothetical protein HY761_04590 [Candidatus Omnitrophica bacterium]|nr:hypothetical protein [Candidatus Omnitrophota bacterium]